MKKYSIYGLLPMTREQSITYLKGRNELTQIGEKFVITGGVPHEKVKDGKTVIVYKEEAYSGYDEYFNNMVACGIFREAYLPC